MTLTDEQIRHDDSWPTERLEELRLQYKNAPLLHATKQAYINGLEYELRAALSLQGEAVPIDDNAWELLAMELAEDDHDDIHQLIYEGYPPEPWGEVWMRYESEAKRILKLAAKYTSPPITTAQQSELEKRPDASQSELIRKCAEIGFNLGGNRCSEVRNAILALLPEEVEG